MIMDKNLVNNQIVSMRKNVKIAKNQIHRKIFKQISQIKRKINKWEKSDNVDLNIKQKHLKDLNVKLKHKQVDAKELKTVTPDTISKYALIHDSDHLSSMLKKSNISVSDRLMARVCQHRLIQTNVKKFRQENPGCDQWLPVQIELWEEKRQHKAVKIKKNKEKTKNKKKNEENQTNQQMNTEEIKSFIQKNQINQQLLIKSSPNKSKLKVKIKTPRSLEKSPKLFTPTFQITKIDTTSTKASKDNRDILMSLKTNRTALIRRIDLNSIKSENILNDKEDEESKNKTISDYNNVSVFPKKQVKDKFFLTDEEKQEDDENDKDLIKLKETEDDEAENNTIKNQLYSKFNFPTSKRFNKFDRNQRLNSSPNKKNFINNKNKFSSNVKRPSRRYFDMDGNNDQQKQETIHSKPKSKQRKNKKFHSMIQQKISKTNTSSFNEFFFYK